MLTPDLAGFKKLARKGNLIAVAVSLPADLETPVSAFLKLAAHAPHAFLLESAEQNETIGRYSFIGLEPKAIVSSQKGRVSVQENGVSKPVEDLSIVDVLEKRLKGSKLA